MRDESEHDELYGGWLDAVHEDLHEDLREDLHSAFDAEVAGLPIGASPIADVMRDGVVRRVRRRVAVTSGVAALAVLPVAAVAVFAGGAGARAKETAVNAASSPPPSSAPASPNPPPIVVPTPLPAPGQLNPRLPNDSVVVLASGTADGKHWRLVRDRYVVAGPELENVVGDSNSPPHLPYAANWGKHGTIECDFTGIQWGDDVPGSGQMFGAGGRCNPTDEGSITRVPARFDGGSTVGDPKLPDYAEGRIDGTDVACVTVDIDGWSSGKQPVIQVPGEQNGYYVVMLPDTARHYKVMVTRAYDAKGRLLGSQQEQGMIVPVSAPSSSAAK